MPLVLSDLLASKKFLFTLAVTLAVLVAGHLSLLSKPEILALLGILWPVYLGAQGVADVGAKIVTGRVAQEQLFGQRDVARTESINNAINAFMPAFLKAMDRSGTVGGPIPSPPFFRALSKGDRVLSLTLGPDQPGEVLEDVPSLEYSDMPRLVRCRFGGKEAEHERLDLALVPTETVLPLPTTPAARAAAIPSLKKV
jgi:hypothetical protein